MKKPWFAFILAVLGLALTSTAALATVYDFSSIYPACSSSSGVWSQSGTTYTCSSGSMSLAAGDSIVAASSITVVAESGITLAGRNTIGSSSVAVNLQTAWGDIVASNSGNKTTTFYGNLTSSSGDINLTNALVYGYIDTLDHAVLSGGSVTGNVSGRNGVTTTNGTVIGGNVTANAGKISLSGGSVTGSVHSDCCTITATHTDIGGNLSTTVISSSSNTVTIIGGTVSGSISTSGGSGIVIKGGATVTSGSITATGVAIEISNSTIGSSTSQVNVTGDNKVTITGSTVWGNVTAGNWASALSIDSSVIYGICTSDNNSVTTPTQYPHCATAPSGPDHIRVFFNNNTTALTCAPRTLDAIACKNSNCAALYASPVSVTLGPGGTAATIPAGGTGTPSVAQSTEGAATIALAASSPAVTALSCYSGTVASPGSLVSPCNLTFSKSGFFVSAPDHVSGVTQTLTITAAKTDDKTKTCVPAFNGVSRNVKLRFAYVNPASGAATPVVPAVGSASPPTSALATAIDLSLAMTFTSGVATTNFRYNDAGSLSVSASYTGSAATGDVGLVMDTVAGSAFVVAPANFLISGIPAAPLTAGSPFNITVTARNNSGATTANFGRETPIATAATALLTSSNPLPGLGNATAISQTLSGFNKGVASTDLKWNEVGTVDITATTSKYLASSLDVVGTQAAVGRFKPAYFDTIVSHGCSGAFTYAGLTTPAIAGQPFTVEVKAKRYGGDLTDSTNTANYAGTAWAKAVTLSDANGGSGTLANNSFTATDFVSGKAKRDDVSYAMATKLTAPYALTIRAVDVDSVSSSGHTEGSTPTRSGRLRPSNAFGSEKVDLKMPVQAQYWSGKSWVLNSDDSCTSLPASAFALYPFGIATSASAVALSSGKSDLTLTKPSPSPVTTGYVDVAANLGASGSGNDLSCLTYATTQASTPAGLPWLRSLNGNCSATYDRDPSARASFGIYSPESKRTVDVRESY
ncbi:MAG: LamG protein [Proteobacteria bacterium]|nr:LamG protein [Pseudomonadota bacterium]